MNRSHHLGELQYAIMRVLWEEGEATVARVRESLERRWSGRALTTIATMLSKLEKKGAITHRSEGRQFVYRPLVDEKAVHRTMVTELTERLFHGDVSALVSHLLTQEQIDPTEIERLRSMIEARKAVEDPTGDSREEGSQQSDG
jgi:BlaI family penicillinase repressor